MAETEANALYLAAHLLSVGRHQATLDALARAPSDEIESTEYWRIRALALYGLRDYEASLEAARKGLELNPEDIELLDMLALSEIERGFPSRAMHPIAKALEVSPDNPTLLAHRAFALARRHDFASAEDAIEEALRLAPESRLVLYTRAQIALLANDGRASSFIDDLLRIDPEDRGAHILRGRLANRKRHFVSAARSWERAARLDPGDQRVVAAAREARVHAHPLLAPARLFWRLHQRPLSLVSFCILLWIVTVGLGHFSFWLFLAALMFPVLVILLAKIGPAVIRGRQNRTYGDL